MSATIVHSEFLDFCQLLEKVSTCARMIRNFPHPQRVQEMLKYAQVVRTAAARHEGWGWKSMSVAPRVATTEILA